VFPGATLVSGAPKKVQVVQDPWFAEQAVGGVPLGAEGFAELEEFAALEVPFQGSGEAETNQTVELWEVRNSLEEWTPGIVSEVNSLHEKGAVVTVTEQEAKRLMKEEGAQVYPGKGFFTKKHSLMVR
jgi:hypothetical protein